MGRRRRREPNRRGERAGLKVPPAAPRRVRRSPDGSRESHVFLEPALLTSQRPSPLGTAGRLGNGSKALPDQAGPLGSGFPSGAERRPGRRFDAQLIAPLLLSPESWGFGEDTAWAGSRTGA